MRARAATAVTLVAAAAVLSGAVVVNSVDDHDPGAPIYLTFDDGPGPHTATILDILEEHDVRAVFFAIGSQLAEYPAVARRVVADGHVLANHTWSHPDLTSLDQASLEAELTDTATALRELGSTSRCVRPPMASTNSDVEAALQRLGWEQVLWNVDTEDWTRPVAADIADRLLDDVSPGDVVLMHDGGGDRSQTAQALRRALPELIGRGHTFDIVPDCY